MRTLALALMIGAAGCTGPGSEPARETEGVGVTTRADIRYLALGDSYTIGESVRPAERWPEVLAALLRGEGLAAVPQVIARTGWTTAELDAAIDRADPQGRYDLVTLMIGVNDQFRGLDLDGFRERFAALLERSIGFAGGEASRVLTLTIPDWGVTPFGAAYDAAAVAAQIDAFNEVIVAEAATRGVAVVDVTTVSREAGADPGLVASDGLHPSPELHRIWAETVLPMAITALTG